MAETLREKQSRFALMIVQLLNEMTRKDYQFTFGDFYRDPRLYGHPRSLHRVRLAADINLFRDGQYLASTHDHLPFGEFWESIGGTWGGRFNDGNHYSLEHDGMK